MFKPQKNIFAIGLGILLLYIAGIFSLSLLDQAGFNDVVLYQYPSEEYASSSFIDYFIKPVILVSGALLITIFPGILFAGILFRKDPLDTDFTGLLCRSFILNIFLLFLGVTIIKLFGITVNRFWFITMILIWMIVGGLLSAGKLNFPLPHRGSLFYFGLLIFIMGGFILLFHDSIFYPLPVKFDYSMSSVTNLEASYISDYHEEFGIVHYLKSKILPYWFVPSLKRFATFIFWPPLSYFLNFFSVMFFGQSYAALGILSLIFILGIFLFVYKIILFGREGEKKNILFYFGPAFFMLNFLLLLMKSERRTDLPFMLWPENCFGSTIDIIWVFLIIGAIYFLLNTDFTLVFMFSMLATLCRYESILYLFILLSIYYFYFKEYRVFTRRIIKYYMFFLALFSLYVIIPCLFQKDGLKYLSELIYNRIFIRFDFLRSPVVNFFGFITAEEKIWPYFSWANTMLFIKTIFLATYFFIFLFFVPSSDRVVNFISLFGIIYLLSVIFQSHKLLYYGYLLVPLAAAHLRRITAFK